MVAARVDIVTVFKSVYFAQQHLDFCSHHRRLDTRLFILCLQTDKNSQVTRSFFVADFIHYVYIDLPHSIAADWPFLAFGLAPMAELRLSLTYFQVMSEVARRPIRGSAIDQRTHAIRFAPQMSSFF